MKHLKNLLTKPLRQLPNSLIIVLCIVALLGFADATYLTVEHYSGVIPPCTVGGCEQVLTSEYATFAGVPIALGGSVYYFVILLGLLVYFESKKEIFLRASLLLTIFGFITSIYLFYLQASVLEAFCLYCLGSALTSTLLFALAIFVFTKYATTDSQHVSDE